MIIILICKVNFFSRNNTNCKLAYIVKTKSYVSLVSRFVGKNSKVQHWASLPLCSYKWPKLCKLNSSQLNQFAWSHSFIPQGLHILRCKVRNVAILEITSLNFVSSFVATNKMAVKPMAMLKLILMIKSVCHGVKIYLQFDGQVTIFFLWF